MYKINSISPFLRCPATDITGGVTSHQLLGRCAKQEMEMMDCLEAYGMDRGVKKCSELIDDFSECHNLNKQFKRFVAIRSERNRQIAAGKLTGDNKVGRRGHSRKVGLKDEDLHLAIEMIEFKRIYIRTNI